MSNETNILLLCVSIHVCVWSLSERLQRRVMIHEEEEAETEGKPSPAWHRGLRFIHLAQDLFTLKFFSTKETRPRPQQDDTQTEIQVLNLVQL